MAPELLEKKQSTRSSDIYAVGVLLFYLVCGEYPVAGASAEDVLDAHRTGRRRHLADYVQVPPALENLIDRALARDPEQRFHSAGAMLAALDEILQDHPVRWRRKRTIYVAVGVLAAACSAVIVRQAVRPSEQGTAQQLNKYDGVYHELSLSDDGRVAAFSSDRAGNLDGDIWVEHPGRADAVPITGPGSNEHEAAISPDGTMVAYRSDRDNGAVYVNSTLGKHERLVAPYGRYPRFSPDGTRLAYWTGEEGNLSAPTAKTFVVPVSGGVPKQILPDFADCRFPVWSPDGKFLLITATRDKNVAPADGRDWWLVPVDEPGQPEELGLYPRLHSMSDRMRMNIRPHLYPPHWAGSQIVFGVHEGNLGKIWQVQIKSHRLSGDPTSITQGSTDDLSEPWNLADGTLAYSNFHSRINVWSLLLDSPESPEVRVTKAVDFELAPHVSADGQHLLFTRLVGNEYSTFFRDINATEPNSLSLPPGSTSINRAIISHDGQQIFYTAMMSSRQQVYEYALNSRDNRLICEKCGTPVDFFASQNKLLCTDDRRLTLVDPVKGDSLPLLQQDGHQFTDAAISPAGDRIAFVSRLDADHRQIFLANLHGTEVEPSEKWLEITTPNTWSDKPRWSPDGSKLYFFSTVDGFGCFYFQEFDGRGKPQGDVRALRHFHKIAKSTLELSQFALNLAVGGGKLFFTLDETSSNMWIQRMRIR
jgi:Tol biopolymer transport system component